MRTSRRVAASTPLTSTTLFRLEVPRITASFESGTPSDCARKLSTSAFALPPTGGEATLSFGAFPPQGPSKDVRLAPDETLRQRRILSLAGVRKSLLTPAQEAAGPEDAAIPAILFGGGALIPIEELLRAALLGQ